MVKPILFVRLLYTKSFASIKIKYLNVPSSVIWGCAVFLSGGPGQPACSWARSSLVQYAR